MTESRSLATNRSAMTRDNGEQAGVRTQSTSDHTCIRQWAARHQAEPATGEATISGPATICVNDGAAGIRFNFPGAGRFRPISWEEWLGHFDQHQLLFVYEQQDPGEVARLAYQLFNARGCQHGSDREDWRRAEQDLQRHRGGSTFAGYRIVAA